MQQRTSKRVCDFAHRFLNIQTELTKLIHYARDGKGLELQYAFALKLRSDLQTEIIKIGATC